MILDQAIIFLKAASMPPGARWITVRPHGPGTEGQAVMIQPSPDGAYRVIGGAGGKLNYLKLTGVKSEAEYKDHLRSKAAGKAEEKKRQRERDTKDGLTEGKKQAREALKAALGDHQAKFVATVAKALNWTQDEMRFPEEKYQNVSAAALAKAQKEHSRALMRRATEAVDQQRQKLLNDGEARAEAGLAEVPLTSASADDISVQDLDPIAPETKGLGFSTDYGKRSEARGLTKESLAAEVEETKPPPPSDGKPSPVEKRKATASAIASELKDIRDTGPTVDPKAAIDAKQAVELLKAEKGLREAMKVGREKAKLIDTAREPLESKSYLIEVGAPVDQDVVKDLENDFRTLRTRAFLEGMGKMVGNPESLGRHVGSGAFNAVNSLALAASGASLVDRSVVDVLGIAGAAQVLARRLQTDLTAEDLGNVREAMGRYHVDHYMALSDSALRQAREWHDAANEIEIGEATNGHDLAAAQELNATRRDFVQKAQQILGTSLGEMEANAALVVALGQPAKDKLQVPLGSVSIENAIKQVRAIGLDRGDYQIEKVGANTILTVTGAGMDKLAQPVAKEDLVRTKQSLDIIEGRQDEDNWLPDGVANRPDMAMTVKGGTAARLAKPMPVNPPDMDRALQDFIGGRIADGESAADVMAAVLSEDTLQRSGDRPGFMAALNKIAPLYEDGKMIRAETHQAAFERMADEFVERTYGADRSPLHRQQFPVDDVAVDALHRALAEHPDGVAASKPVGELTPQDQGALRNAFSREYGRMDPDAARLQDDLDKVSAAEPEKETEDMFGRSMNPLWRDWQTKRDDLAQKVNAATMTWGKYLDVMGSPANAYASMQDVIKSKMLRSFAGHMNKLRPETPLKIGHAVIANDLNHLDALDPVARENRLAQHRGLIDTLRNRVAGKYSSGSVSDKLDAARASDEAASQAQMGLFGAEEPAAAAGDETDTDAAPEPRATEMGERYTIGHAAERQVAGMMPIVGKMFHAGEPVKLWQPTMSGKYVGRQRAVKLIAQNKRVMLGMGVGSGKTSIALSAWAHQHSKGAVGRGMFLVPSVVQGQFHGEALTVLQPGKFNWHCNPGASRDERIKAYKDPKVDFNVVTHQAFRDDMLHLASVRDGTTPEAVATKLDGMKPAERASYMKDLMASEGIDHTSMTVDEGHNLLNRSGKQNSHMANVIDSASANMDSYVNMTADPVKNDASEAFDVLAKMDPARYSDRDAFLRKYGVDTASAKEGLRREMVRHFYLGQVDPGVKHTKSEVSVTLGQGEHDQVKALNDAASRGRLARMDGKVDVEAMRTLSPGSFADVDPARHEEVAGKLQNSIGIMHSAAVHHAINGPAKVDALVKEVAARGGKPGVVFAHSLDRVHEIADRLRKEGRRPVMLTGADSGQEKDKKRRGFNAGEHDIMVVSDAGAVGANLQHGKFLIQFDTPQTAMLHAQRDGRINRVGQTEDVELVDLLADHPAERKARKRLADKYELRDIMTSPLEGLDDRGIAGYLKRTRAGEQEAAEPMHRPAAPHEVPEGLSQPDEQSSLF